MAVPEATLKDAADNVFGDVYTFWLNQTLRTRTLALVNDTIASVGFSGSPLFPYGVANNQPVLDGLAVLGAFTTGVAEPATRMLYTNFVDLCNALYRVLWMANYLHGEGLISNAQATELLDQFNAAYTP